MWSMPRVQAPGRVIAGVLASNEREVTMSRLLLKPLIKRAERLKHPTLFWITATLFVLDLLVPDFIPFADEILLGLGTLLLSRWRVRDVDPDPRR